MPKGRKDIQRGQGLQSSGDWRGALACYRRAVRADPADAEALFLAGVAEAHEGNPDGAERLLRLATERRPGFGEAVKALGAVLLSQSRHAEAAAALERAAGLGPESAAVHFDLGSAHQALAGLERAAGHFERAAELRPGFADAYNKLGNVLMALERHEEAERAYARATEASPRASLGWYNLGFARQAQKRTEAAAEAYRRSIELDPANADAENNLGLILAEEGRVGEAILCFRRALQARPAFAMAGVNLATALQRENRLDESEALLRGVIRAEPSEFRAHAALGNAHMARNEFGKAEAAYRQALERKPGSPELRYNLALVHLVRGELAAGWEGYEARLETERHREKFALEGVRWHRGEPIAGRTLLVYAEQGLGDTLQFSRYVPLLEGLGARVVLRVQQALGRLLSAQWPGVRVIGTGDPLPAYDLYASLLSLPHEFGTTLGSIPAAGPYLRAPQGKVDVWRKVFSHAGGLKVGLVWSGNPRHQYDHNRSMPLGTLAGVARGVPAHFFSLQKEPRLGAEGWPPGITDLSAQLVDFEDTAAIVAALDLVVTVDTSVAHLAGALGTKAWVMVGFAPDWRWLLGRGDSPWYPSVRLFRQREIGEWEPAVREAREALVAWAGRGSSP